MGQEFGIIGIGAILVAISLLIQKINQPSTCKVRRAK